MNTLANINELARAIRNMVGTGIIVETDLDAGRCRVQTGGIITDWLQWLTQRAGRYRTWWAPSVGEQVLILAVGGELDTAFVLPGIFSDENPAPSASADAWHVAFPDGAVIEYEPKISALTVSGIKTADVTASQANVFALTTVYSTKAQAMRAAKAKWDKLQRGVAEFSISLPLGRADLYPETPVRVSGFKSIIDEQAWIITKVTHALNSNGYTTVLELEVKLSDIEYEAGDDDEDLEEDEY